MGLNWYLSELLAFGLEDLLDADFSIDDGSFYISCLYTYFKKDFVIFIILHFFIKQIKSKN